jgi:hypothetical protein
LLAEKTLEVDFFKGALQKVEARASAAHCHAAAVLGSGQAEKVSQRLKQWHPRLGIDPVLLTVYDEVEDGHV